MMWYLDANACIHYLRERYSSLTVRWHQHRSEDLALPLPVYAELLVGAEKSGRPERAFQQITSLIEVHEVVEITKADAKQYARIRAHLERRGEPIGMNDLWIAAMALSVGATLVTNNTREFSRVPDLVLEDRTLS